MRALRIGYRPTTSEVLTLREGESRELRLELTGAAISLRGVAVTADRQCASQSAASAALDAWDEARRALDTALLSRGEPLQVSVVRRERRIRTSDGVILSEHDEPHHGISLRPYVSIPAATIAAKGYVIPDGDAASYAAPDDEILLAPDFASTHCLRLIAASADSLALGFAPGRDRRLPEIAGVVLLDPATHELRELAFHYVNTEQRAPDAGGRVHFRRLAAGRWMVDRWSLRLPVLAHVVSQRVGTMSDLRSGLRRTTTLEVTEYQETSGEVTEVARGGELLWASTPSIYEGSLVDERGGAVSAAIVRLPMLERETQTDSNGRFRFDGVASGAHQLVVSTPLLDSLGIPPLEPVRSSPNGVADLVRFSMPSRGALIRGLCALPAGEASDSTLGLMRGVTRPSKGRDSAASRSSRNGSPRAMTAGRPSSAPADRGALSATTEGSTCCVASGPRKRSECARSSGDCRLPTRVSRSRARRGS